MHTEPGVSRKGYNPFRPLKNLILNPQRVGSQILEAQPPSLLDLIQWIQADDLLAPDQILQVVTRRGRLPDKYGILFVVVGNEYLDIVLSIGEVRIEGHRQLFHAVFSEMDCEVAESHLAV